MYNKKNGSYCYDQDRINNGLLAALAVSLYIAKTLLIT